MKIQNGPRVNYYNLETNKNITKKRILLLADIQANIKALFSLYRKIEEIENSLDQQNIDTICIPGDTLENTLTDRYLTNEYKDLLKFLRDLAKPIIMVNGNHDVEGKAKGETYRHVDELWLEKLREIDNLHLLEKNFKGIVINDILFMGLTMPFSWYKNHKESSYKAELLINDMKKDILPEEYYNILLSHSPRAFLRNNSFNPDIDMPKNLDLILSGHMHGGLMPNLLRLNSLKGKGLVGPYNSLFPDACYGQYYNDQNDTTMIITSGVTKLSRDSGLGFLNPLYKSDIDVIDIENPRLTLKK